MVEDNIIQQYTNIYNIWLDCQTREADQTKCVDKHSRGGEGNATCRKQIL